MKLYLLYAVKCVVVKKLSRIERDGRSNDNEICDRFSQKLKNSFFFKST